MSSINVLIQNVRKPIVILTLLCVILTAVLLNGCTHIKERSTSKIANLKIPVLRTRNISINLVQYRNLYEKDPTFEKYENAIKKHGGKVEKLFIGDEGSTAKIDGLLLPGGGDIDPEIYGEVRHPNTQYVNEERDEFEISLFREAIEKDIPVFGICRGIQIMNVAMGGSLYQNIKDLIPEALTHKGKSNKEDVQHEIEIEFQSRLGESDDIHKTQVNSAHRQAVDDIGKGLVVTARSRDGIIEAMEYPSKRFVIGVQYHPERMWKDKNPPLPNREFLEHAKRLFGAFINAASR